MIWTSERGGGGYEWRKGSGHGDTKIRIFLARKTKAERKCNVSVLGQKGEKVNVCFFTRSPNAKNKGSPWSSGR